ncbi:uncharacterized protein LOC111595500 [Drosophila hydei]|uniref:Uncharacterized protein LOC111595500 n=1 Tax=Drosophila hydei TaxID=7224 RepID=A0A6J1LNA0_DROHY|nr:uncharacterized protein LOC111595500 [Drosophila hydei]
MNGSDPSDGPSGSKSSKGIQTSKSLHHVKIVEKSNVDAVPLMVNRGSNTDDKGAYIFSNTESEEATADADSVRSWPGKRKLIGTSLSLNTPKDHSSESGDGSDSNPDDVSPNPPVIVSNVKSRAYNPERLIDGSVCLTSSS